MNIPVSTMSRRHLVVAGAAAAASASLLSNSSSTFARQSDASGTVRLAIYNINDSWHQTFQGVIDAFHAAHPNIQVEVEIRPGEQYYDKLQIEYASGSGPDISVNDMEMVVAFAARGMLLDLKPYFERDAIDQSQYWYSHDTDWGWKDGLWGGLMYAGGQMLFINLDILEAAGLTVPSEDWTWDDLTEYARAMTIPDQNQFGLHFGIINPPYWGTSFIHGAGGTVLNEARDEATLTSTETRAGLTYLADLMLKEGLIPVPSATEGQDNLFMTGKVGMYFGGTWDEAAVRSAGFRWDFARMPIHPQTGLRFVQEGSNAWSVLSSSSNPDAAWEVVKYLIGVDAQTGIMGLGLPVLDSVVNSAEFKALHSPQNIDLTLKDFRDHGHNYYATPDAGEWWNAVDQEFSVIWSGEATVDEATQRANDSINDIFRQRLPEWSE